MKLTHDILATLVYRGYAKRVRKIVDPTIKTPQEVIGYAIDILGGRFPEGEKYLGVNPHMATLYAGEFNVRLPKEVEDEVLAMNTGYSARYRKMFGIE